MLRVLMQCNGDFARENVMKQPANLRDLELPVLLPAIKISVTNYRPLRQRQLQKWDGKTGCASAR